jgi:hypothetical protein
VDGTGGDFGALDGGGFEAQGGFQAQDSWLGCNGILGALLLVGVAIGGLAAVLLTLFRLVGEIERAATAARLTDSRNA